MVTAWKPLLAAAVIFIAGVGTGGFTSRNTSASDTENPAPTGQPNQLARPRLAALQRLQAELKLSTQQRRRVAAILRESQQRTRELWERIAPEVHEVQQRTRERIKAELTDEQRTRFDDAFNKLPMSRMGEYRPADKTRPAPPSAAAPPAATAEP